MFASQAQSVSHSQCVFLVRHGFQPIQLLMLLQWQAPFTGSMGQCSSTVEPWFLSGV